MREGEKLEDADSARLIRSFQAGDADAFEALYQRYFDRLYSYLLVVLTDAHEVEDAVQEVFMKVWEALPRYEPGGRDPFRAYLFTVARNHALNRMRKRSRVKIVAPAAIEGRLDAADAHEDDLAALGWVSDSELLLLIERLPLAQRQALALRYMMDFTHEQIGSILGRSTEDVRSLNSRGVRFLRARLAALGRTQSAPRVRMRGRVRQAPVLRRRRFALRGSPPPGFR
jgi:RNA polymerase sigma-70 factor (ECF subfamily)